MIEKEKTARQRVGRYEREDVTLVIKCDPGEPPAFQGHEPTG
jgi:hypothetical protein